MQLLITTATLIGSQPIYLPYDKAPVPFGDPLAATVTSAGPAIFTVPGYVPTVQDAVSVTIEGATNASGLLSTGAYLTTQAALAGFIQLATTYYVSGVSATNTFTLGTQKATATSLASLSTLGWTTGVFPVVHLLSQQVDGTVLPFKPNNTVVAWNAGNAALVGTTAYGSITLFGAADLTTVYGNPIGPGAYTVIATIGYGTPKLIQLNNDWIVASGSTSTLVLLQN
jgi:hypothetical protein